MIFAWTRFLRDRNTHWDTTRVLDEAPCYLAVEGLNKVIFLRISRCLSAAARRYRPGQTRASHHGQERRSPPKSRIPLCPLQSHGEPYISGIDSLKSGRRRQTFLSLPCKLARTRLFAKMGLDHRDSRTIRAFFTIRTYLVVYTLEIVEFPAAVFWRSAQGI